MFCLLVQSHEKQEKILQEIPLEDGNVLKRERLSLSLCVLKHHLYTSIQNPLIKILLAFYSCSQHLWNNDDIHSTGLVLWGHKSEWDMVPASPERGHNLVGRQAHR